jgi:predicted amidohydrolase
MHMSRIIAYNILHLFISAADCHTEKESTERTLAKVRAAESTSFLISCSSGPPKSRKEAFFSSSDKISISAAKYASGHFLQHDF